MTVDPNTQQRADQVLAQLGLPPLAVLRAETPDDARKRRRERDRAFYLQYVDEADREYYNSVLDDQYIIERAIEQRDSIRARVGTLLNRLFKHA